MTEVNGAGSRSYLGDHHTSSSNGFAAANGGAQNGHTALRAGVAGATGAAVAVSRPAWERRYSWAVAANDLLAMGLALGVGMFVGLGESASTPHLAEWTALIIAVGFTVAMVACRAWEARILGSGSEEYSRLVRGMLNSLVTLGMVGLAFHVESVRGWVFLIIPLAGALAIGGRFLLRKPLHRRRARGECQHKVLAIGAEDFVVDLLERTRRDPSQGWYIAAACTPSGDGGTVRGVPVVGDFDSAGSAALSGDYGVVAVAATGGWTPRRLHQFSWDLEGCGADLVVHPGLMEVSGPRLHVAPVDGLPLLRLTEPTFTGIPRLVKSAMDVVGAALLLLILAPLLAVVYMLVRLDGGPGFFLQSRVGLNGQSFRMVKFRTMVPDAEKLRSQLEAANEGAGPLFKLKRDPRVTPVGGLLRRYSLDELPQLFNVLLGSMSLVGPRPPLQAEVDTYTRDAHRKLMVKPGLTGLWQISGRSNLSWEESVRLDLRYVENWNLALDAVILWKTLRAVISSDGAY